MDQSILLENGVKPSHPRKGYLEDYALRIGNRASLIPHPHERSYGIVMTVAGEAVDQLYGEASVSDYVPEEVDIMIDTSERVRAVCYNLPAASLTGTNPSYARSLYQLAKSEGFPEGYLEKIKKMAEDINRI